MTYGNIGHLKGSSNLRGVNNNMPTRSCIMPPSQTDSSIPMEADTEANPSRTIMPPLHPPTINYPPTTHTPR